MDPILTKTFLDPQFYPFPLYYWLQHPWLLYSILSQYPTGYNILGSSILSYPNILMATTSLAPLFYPIPISYWLQHPWLLYSILSQYPTGYNILGSSILSYPNILLATTSLAPLFYPIPISYWLKHSCKVSVTHRVTPPINPRTSLDTCMAESFLRQSRTMGSKPFLGMSQHPARTSRNPLRESVLLQIFTYFLLPRNPVPNYGPERHKTQERPIYSRPG